MKRVSTDPTRSSIRCQMQKSLSDLTSLSPEELTFLMEQITEPLLVTNNGQPQFVAQSLTGFESMISRLRALERKQRTTNLRAREVSPAGAKVIPFRR
jgi:PHD/YefM family antitoxin component YafN of YafNO toxin-antitoxin module